MDTTHGPTYSMARAIRATSSQKGSICRYQCHCLHCCSPDSQVWPVCELVTLTYQWLHSLQHWGLAHVKSDGKSASSVHTTLVYMSCRANGMLHQCAAMYRPLWHSCWTASASQTHSPCAVHIFCVVLCGLRLCYAQSHSDIKQSYAYNCSDHVLHVYLFRLTPQWHAFV